MTPREYQFQSTLPVRGATMALFAKCAIGQDFNPRSPCGERPGCAPTAFFCARNFNPRSPCGERRLFGNSDDLHYTISIHAPRAGSDAALRGSGCVHQYFNPRSPCGERHEHRGRSAGEVRFQSTLPMRGATTVGAVQAGVVRFQSTLPMRGATKQRHLRA